MLGALIGDTVGSIYEFCNIKTTDFPLFSDGSSFTDDSVMTIAVADWLLHDPVRSQRGMAEHSIVGSLCRSSKVCSAIEIQKRVTVSRTDPADLTTRGAMVRQCVLRRAAGWRSPWKMRLTSAGVLP